MTQMDRVALDIETIPTVDDPEFDRPEHWIPFAVALGHQPQSGGDIEVDVLFRDSDSLRSEGKLLDRTVDWVADRASGDREVLTYNGTSYDIPILQHRAREIDGVEPGVRVSQRLELLLETSTHTDLMDDMRAARGYHVSLDDALAEHGIEADSPNWLGKPITGADMPSMGLELLSDRPNPELQEAVRRYAASDVEPLFKLHDELRSGRVDRH